MQHGIIGAAEDILVGKGKIVEQQLGLNETLRSLNLKIENTQRELAGLRQDVKKLLHMVKKISFDATGSKHDDLRDSREESESTKNK